MILHKVLKYPKYTMDINYENFSLDNIDNINNDDIDKDDDNDDQTKYLSELIKNNMEKLNKIKNENDNLPLTKKKTKKDIKNNKEKKHNELREKCNLLVPKIREATSKSIDVKENDILYNLLCTTMTLSGELKNADKLDDKDTSMFKTNKDVVKIVSNYSELVDSSYVEPVKEKKSTRGRKKMEKKENNRKKQGSGKHMSSQITFVVRIKKEEDTEKLYKFKVFKGNTIQLPGAHTDYINEVLDAWDKVNDVLNEGLHPNEENTEKLVSLENIYANMKNYKFFVKMQPNQVLNLSNLKETLTKIKDNKINDNKFNINQNGLKIYDIIYNKNDTKLDVQFIYIDNSKQKEEINDEDNEIKMQNTEKLKPIRVDIFPGHEIPANYDTSLQNSMKNSKQEPMYGGKINIKGSINEEVTKKIYNFILELFKYYKHKLICNKNTNINDYKWIVLAPPDNIEEYDKKSKIEKHYEAIRDYYF